MKKKGESKIRIYAVLSLILLFAGSRSMVQRQMENLDRGIMAIDEKGILIGDSTKDYLI